MSLQNVVGLLVTIDSVHVGLVRASLRMSHLWYSIQELAFTYT